MPSSQGIRAGAAYVEITANDSRLVKGLNAASAKLKSFGAGVQSTGLKMAALGAGILTPLLTSAKMFSDVGDALDKMSKRTGLSVEALSELSFAAEASGTSIEEIESAVRKMQKTIAAAGDASEEARDKMDSGQGGKNKGALEDTADEAFSGSKALLKLGVTIDRLRALKPEDQFLLIARRLKEVADPTEKAALAMSIFGRAGTSLLPLLDDMDALRKEARRLGVVMSTEDARAAADLNDAFGRVQATLRSVVLTVGGTLAPLLTEIADYVAGVVSSFRAWLSHNQGLVVSLLKLGGLIAGAGVAFVALGGAASAVGTVLGYLASVIGAVFSAILSPIGLVVTGLAALAAYILYATGTGAKALKWLGEKFELLKDFALESFDGIKDALAAGDIALAAQILWLSLQVAWRKGVSVLQGYWLAFKESFLSIATDAFYGAVALLAESWAGMQKFWVETSAWMGNVWSNFTEGVLFGWRTTQYALEKGLYDIIELFQKFPKLTETLFPGIAGSLKLLDLDTLNPEEARKQAAKSLRADTDSLEANRKAEIERRNRKRKEDLRGIEQERRGTLAAIGNEADQEDRRRRAQNEKDLKASQDALEKAKAERQQALAEAKAKRKAFDEGSKQPEAEAPPEVGVPDLAGQIHAAIATLPETLKNAFEVVGTFNAEALQGFGVGPSVAERAAKAGEETAKNTKRILQEMQDNGLAFE